jgi:hypothetical protein
MIAVQPDILEDAIKRASPPDMHPILDWVDSAAVEDAAMGGAQGVQSLLKRRKGRGLSRDEFEQSKGAAETVGRQGEEVLNGYLDMLKKEHKIQDFRWVSQENIISPYDFLELRGGVPARKMDAKSTTGSFSNPIHVSLGELVESQQSDVPYDIYRLYDVREGYAKLRIARDVKGNLKSIVDTIGRLPKGVTVDSVSIAPGLLKFGDEIIIKDEGEAQA